MDFNSMFNFNSDGRSIISKFYTKQDTIPKADVTVKAIGYQWYWGYEYPDENIIFDSYMIETKDLKENQPRLLAVDNEVGCSS
jgi:cytochrome c oxidase subunit 2